MQLNHKDGLNTKVIAGRKGPLATSVTVAEDTQRFERLYTRLITKRKILPYKNEMLSLLLQLSGDGGKASNASSIVGNVFTAKSLNRVDYVSTVK